MLYHRALALLFATSALTSHTTHLYVCQQFLLAPTYVLKLLALFRGQVTGHCDRREWGTVIYKWIYILTWSTATRTPKILFWDTVCSIRLSSTRFQTVCLHFILEYLRQNPSILDMKYYHSMLINVLKHQATHCQRQNASVSLMQQEQVSWYLRGSF